MQASTAKRRAGGVTSVPFGAKIRGIAAVRLHQFSSLDQFYGARKCL
jgi:hypothetical protein